MNAAPQFLNYGIPLSLHIRKKKRPSEMESRCKIFERVSVVQRHLPSTLLMTIRLQTLTTLVLVHLETTFLLEVTHRKLMCGI